MCACGNPAREGIDHTTHVCSTTGFFPKSDLDAINEAATTERNTNAHHRR